MKRCRTRTLNPSGLKRLMLRDQLDLEGRVAACFFRFAVLGCASLGARGLNAIRSADAKVAANRARSLNCSHHPTVPSYLMRRDLVLRLCAALPLWLVLSACGDDECPATATSCPMDGCYPMRAFPFDAAQGCVLASTEIVGCTADEVGTDDAPCVRRLSDGALFIATQGSPFRRSTGWEECTDEEQETVSFCSD